MTREEVLRVLADNIRECVKEGWDGESAIAEALERLDRVEAERWVPFPEEPPTVANWYLCAIRGRSVERLAWDGGRWHHSHDNSGAAYWTGLVTHWRLLPEGPKP